MGQNACGLFIHVKGRHPYIHNPCPIESWVDIKYHDANIKQLGQRLMVMILIDK